MLFILNRDMEVLTVLDNNSSLACPYYSDKNIQYLKQASSYEFVVPTVHPDSEYVIEGNYVIRKDLDGNSLMYTIMTVETTHSDAKERKIYAEDCGLELLTEVELPYTTTSPNVISYYINKSISGTGWELGYCDVIGSKTISFDQADNVLARIIKIAEEFDGAEIKFTVELKGTKVEHRYVNIYKKLGEDTGKRFYYSKDITSINRKVDMSSVCTSLYVEGKTNDSGVLTSLLDLPYDNGDIWKPVGDYNLYSRTGLERWGQVGKHIHAIYSLDTLNRDELLTKAINELQTRINPSVTYECNVALLERLAGIEEEKIRIGDTVKVIDTTFNPPLYLEARIVQMELSYTDPSQDKCTLGNYELVKSNIGADIKAIQSTLLQKEARWSGGEQMIYKQPTPPTHLDGRLWIDTSSTPEIMYRSTGTDWIALSPTEASEIGAVSQTDYESNKEILDWYISAKSSPNLIQNLLDLDLTGQPYEWITGTLPDGTTGNIIRKKHTANQTLQNVGLYFPLINVDSRKSYLLEFYVQPKDSNSKYYYGREELSGGSPNDQGLGPYLISGKIPTSDQIGKWTKHYALVVAHFAGLEGSHATQNSPFTPDYDYKMWDVNTNQIQIKTFLTYAPIDVTKDSEMWATGFGLYEVGTNDALFESIGALDSKIEDKTDSGKIIDTVVYSESFDSILSKKADTEDISDMATGTQLQGVKEDTIKYIDGRIDGEGGVNESINAVSSSLTKSINDIKAQFSSSGGVNLIQNSIGYADTDLWEVTGNVHSIQNQELEILGFGSGFTSTPNEGGYIEQIVNTSIGEKYSISFWLKKDTDNAVNGQATVEIYENNVLIATIGKPSGAGTTKGYELGIYTFDTHYSQITIRVNFGSNAGSSIVSGLMLNIGENALQWQHAPNEIYNTSVQLNLNGIKVINEQTKGYTIMSSQEFSGYGEVVDPITGQATMERIFTLNDDRTEVTRLLAEKQIEMYPIKIVPITSNYLGIAFISTD